MKHRHRVLVMLILLFAITYLDRVCISVAGPLMQADLGIGPVGWGWITGVFTLSYCLFEIPTGLLGDRWGPRRILTRIVLWWSVFTSITGMVSNFYLLLLARFCFGAGEAGVFPNSSIVVARWFPPSQRASISGITLMSAQIGGALAPLLIIPIQMHYGWRVPFYLFGGLGILWAVPWYLTFRDSPAEKAGVTDAELREASAMQSAPSHDFPWRRVLRSRSVIAILAIVFCYVYVYNFFQTWFHTFLVKGRGFSESSLVLSALPFLVAASANLAGGFASDALAAKFGASRGRRIIGVGSLAVAGVCTVVAMSVREPLMTMLVLSLVYGAITFQQAGVFGVCLDLGRKHAGAMVGLMNALSQLGGFFGAVFYGYIVEHTHSYDAPFVPMAALLFAGALIWTQVDSMEDVGLSVTPALGLPA
jgi:MFS transporter, ACS family, glucarate transporter